MKCLAFIAIIVLATTWVSAEHFKIELTIKGRLEEGTAHADTDPPPQGHHPRPIVHAKRGEELTFQFFFTSNFPHDAIKGAKVRYYIAPEQEAGKGMMAEPGKPLITEGWFQMDFKPDTGRVGLRQRLHIDQPGTYIVRAESEHTDSDHEHFAALDLVIE